MIVRRRDRALAVVVAAAARAGKGLIEMTKPIPAATASETAAELRQRKPALLDAISSADAEIAQAQVEHETAFAAFVERESDENARELWLTEQRAKARARRRAEIEAELEANNAALQLAERAEIEQRLEAIDVELTDNRTASELAAIATVAAAQLVDALIAIRKHNVAREDLRNEQQGLRERLGLPLSPAYFRGVDASLLSTAEGLRELAAIEQDPVRRGYLETLALSQIEFRPASFATEEA